MDGNRQYTYKGKDLGPLRVKLPPEISFTKQRLDDSWAYVFRHQSLGDTGRVLLQQRIDGNTQVSTAVMGDLSGPMTVQRAAIFKPLALDIAERMLAATGPVAEAGAIPSPPRPTDPQYVIESEHIPCERCGALVAMIIFAPEATDAGRFEDYARLMYVQYERLNMPTWIIGPALEGGPPMHRPADILKVWPERAPFERLRPDQFNPMLEQLAAGHCHQKTQKG
jgi:hypothetical protein